MIPVLVNGYSNHTRSVLPFSLTTADCKTQPFAANATF